MMDAKRAKRRAGREAIDVEELLTRAYAVHMVDRITVAGLLALRLPSISGVSSTAMICAHAARGTQIDTSTSGANFAGWAGEMQSVPDDMVEVHDAVLRLPRFWADTPAGADFVLWDDTTLPDAARFGFEVIPFGLQAGPDGEALRPAGYRITTLRHSIEAPERKATAYRNGVPLQAATVTDGPVCDLYPRERPVAVPTRPLHLIEPAVALVTNGRAGTRPDLSPLVVERWRPRYSGRRKVVGYDPVWQTLPGAVALQRATYAAWRLSLDLLAGDLAGRLEHFEVLPSTADREPWAGEETLEAPRPRRRHESPDELTG